jgi:predicted oxidoreductase
LPRQWARAYVEFAAGEKQAWLRSLGHSVIPIVSWAERGGYHADGPGNTVPRFHITWGTGPGVVEPFERRARSAGVSFLFRHRVDELSVTDGAVDGVSGAVLAPSSVARGVPSSREEVGSFELHAPVVIVASGGIGGDHERVRSAWPASLSSPPDDLLTGVPAHVDGRMIGTCEAVGGAVINRDRMWHYVEGIKNWDPVWPGHGIRILPGPSSLWLDALGRRLPGPLFPGFDTLGTLSYLRTTGYDHSWFILNKKIIAKEFALSGSEQNPDITGKSRRAMLERVLGGVPDPVQAFLDHGEDFVVASTLPELVDGMNKIVPDPALSYDVVSAEVLARDRAVLNSFSTDDQLTFIRGARRAFSERLVRVASPHRLLDPAAGPLIAVRLRVLTRKSLGGLHTDLSARVLSASGSVVPGLYAVGEAAGFGGGGMHGYRSLEGTFLGGCIFSGRVAGRAAAAAVGG